MTVEEKINKGFEHLVNNLETLKQNYQRLQAENQELFEQKQQLLKTINQKDKEIEELKKKLENLKISNALLIRDGNPGDTEDLQEIKHTAKIKLNKIIKEIDNAIKILSTNELQKS